MRALLVAAACMLASIGSAHAKTHRHHHHHYRVHSDNYRHYAGRPRAWCGWQMRQWMHVTDPAFNLARRWATYGHATTAHVGAIVVWPHHVGRIIGESGGRFIVESGNDGHRVRARARSLAGAIAFRE